MGSLGVVVVDGDSGLPCPQRGEAEVQCSVDGDRAVPCPQGGEA